MPAMSCPHIKNCCSEILYKILSGTLVFRYIDTLNIEGLFPVGHGMY